MNVEEHYFEWLCDAVGPDGDDYTDSSDQHYWILLRALYDIPFVPYVDHDENRAYDGLELRDEFLREMEYPRYTDISGECSVLEMMVGLARRMDFETTDPYDYENSSDRTGYWFWEMIDNLGLTSFDDSEYEPLGGWKYVKRVVDAMVERRYSRDGNGGLFPLVRPSEDQRNVELWYQMSEYLMQNDAC